MQEFSKKTLEEIGLYVYCLVDPRNNKIFYVGKGTGNRVFQHAKGILDINENLSSEKIDIIFEILKLGLHVQYYIIRHGIKDSEIAFEIEASIIDTLEFFGNSLSNIVSGHHSWDRGLKTVQELDAFYGATEIHSSDIIDPILIININRNYEKGNSPIEATSGDWVINPFRANTAKYIIAEYRGIFRSIYSAIGYWEVVSDYAKPRYRVILAEVLDSDIQKRYLNKYLPKKRGSQNPIRYINC